MSPLVLCVAASLVGPINNDPVMLAARKVVAPFAGRWEVLSLEVNGFRDAGIESQAIKVDIQGNRMTFYTDGKPHMVFRAHPGTSPLAVDLKLYFGNNDRDSRDM